MAREGKESADKRLHSLDALRGIAALCVLVSHYANSVDPVAKYSGLNLEMPLELFGHKFSVLGVNTLFELKNGLGFGQLAVQLFYVLSGFIFMYIYQQRITDGTVKLKDFALARISRLYPLVWITTLVLIPLIVYNDGIGGLSVEKVFKNFLLLGGFEGDFRGGIHAINSPIWSLTAEMWAYATFFLICTQWGNKKVVFAVPILLGLFIFQLSVKSIGFFTPDYIRVFIGFFMGCLTYMLSLEAKSKGFSKQLGWGSLLIFVLTAGIGVVTLNRAIGNTVIVYSLLIFPALLIAVLNVKRLRNILSIRLFRWLGDLSFGIYLWHWPVFALFGTLYKKGLHLPLQSKWVMLMIFAVVVVVAHLSFYYFERPVQRIIRKKYSKYKATEQ